MAVVSGFEQRSSLTLDWNKDNASRKQWMEYKESSIKGALQGTILLDEPKQSERSYLERFHEREITQLHKSSDPGLMQNSRKLLKFLAYQRALIAHHMKSPPGFGELCQLNDRANSFGSKTLLNNEKYKSFIPQLIKLFKKMNLPEEGIGFLILELPFSKDCIVKTVMENARERSKLCLSETLNAKTGLPECFAISHPESMDIEEDFKKIDSLFRRLSPNKTENNIVLMLTMCCQIAQAMPWIRGSAAINEMFLSALCRHYHIQLNLDNLPVPLDLIAIFSESPKAMLINMASLLNPDKSDHYLCSDLAAVFPDLKDNHNALEDLIVPPPRSNDFKRTGVGDSKEP